MGYYYVKDGNLSDGVKKAVDVAGGKKGSGAEGGLSMGGPRPHL